MAAQLLVVPGLGQEFVDRAFVDGVGHGLQLRVAGQHDADGVRRQLPGLAQEVGAQHAGHALVGDDDVDRMLGQHRQSLRAVVGAVDLVVVAAQQALERGQDVGFVVHQQQAARRLVHAQQVLRQRAAAGQQLVQFGRGQRRGEEIALDLVAHIAPQEVALALGLHALGHHLHAQVVAHGDDALGHGGVVAVADHVADEVGVDLDGVEGIAFQAAQRAVAGAEVVQRQVQAARLEAGQHVVAAVAGLGQRGLGDLQRQRGRGDRVVVQHGGHGVAEAGVAELAGGDVDRHPQVVLAAAPPGVEVAAGAAQHPVANGGRHAGALGARQEGVGRQQALGGMLPAHQRLQADHGAGLQVHQRLVKQAQLIERQRLFQLGVERKAGGGRQVGRLLGCNHGRAYQNKSRQMAKYSIDYTATPPVFPQCPKFFWRPPRARAVVAYRRISLRWRQFSV
ncbi:hypothetical protein DUGA6_63390 [Duganella sp. HH105]|nr:hypothetical protein DUGA6_63390 [Duganella sp. HH105]